MKPFGRRTKSRSFPKAFREGIIGANLFGGHSTQRGLLSPAGIWRENAVDFNG